MINVSVTTQNAEDILYARLVSEQQMLAGRGEKASLDHYLRCCFFHINIVPEKEKINMFLYGLEGPEEINLYNCDDGDVVIKWSGGSCAVQKKIIENVCKYYGDDIEQYMPIDEFFVDYDLQNIGKLKRECSIKLKKRTRQSMELIKCFSNEALIKTLRTTMQLTKMQRAFRSNPHIMIVEDQKFSLKLLSTILKDYTCLIAESVGDALLKYVEKCPDIVFLDIELPDLSGHHFAELARKIDDDSYIIVVSSNIYKADIDKAQRNQVSGYIGKPFEKENILKMIEQFKKHRLKKKTR